MSSVVGALNPIVGETAGLLGAAGVNTGGAGRAAGGLFYHQNDPNWTDPGPRPEYAGYAGIRDPNTGLISGHGLNLNPQVDQSGLAAFKDRALAAPGTSAWEQMALNKQGLEQNQAMQGAQQQGANAAAQARSGLAMRGGLSSGAAERSGRNSMRDILAAQQNVGAQGLQSRADIGQEAERQRLAALGQLPQMQLNAAQPGIDAQKFNIGNALTQKQAEEQAKFANYQQQMQGYGATQQANAIAANGPKSGGLFGSSGLVGGLFGK